MTFSQPNAVYRRQVKWGLDMDINELTLIRNLYDSKNVGHELSQE